MKIHITIIPVVFLCLISVNSWGETSDGTKQDHAVIPAPSKSEILDFLYYILDITKASNKRDYDRIISSSENYLGKLAKDEFTTVLRNNSYNEEYSFHLYTYAMLTWSYDRKGYCFHANKYHREYMELLKSKYIIVWPYNQKVYYSDWNPDEYLEFEDYTLELIDIDMEPFRRCLSKKDHISMFDPTVERIIREFEE